MKKKNNNILNIITIIIAIISCIISIFSNIHSKEQINLEKYPNIILETLKYNIDLYYFKQEYYTNSPSNSFKINILNIGNGVTKNIKFIWNEENSNNLKKIIKQIDKKNEVTIKEENGFITINEKDKVTSFLNDKNRYKKNIDYLLPEKDEKSNQTIEIPIEYLMYLEVILRLAKDNNIDFDEIIDDIKLYLNIDYRDINNDLYEKIMILNVEYNIKKLKEKDKNIYYKKYEFNIKEDI